MAWSSEISRRVVALVAAGVLLVLVALGYLVLRTQLAGGRLEREQQLYQKWINGFAAGLGDRRAVVILEPDALAQLDSCLDSDQQQARLQMLAYAVKTLRTGSDQVFLDAGHADWVPAPQMAARLRAADIARADGFALNVSNYDPTAREVGYATALNRNLGMGKRFVVDTSRNGRGSSGAQVRPAAFPLSRALPAAHGGTLASELFTNPDTQAASWVRANRGDPRAQEIKQRIASQPTATWFGGWNRHITAAVSRYTIAASRHHKVPVLVAYNIPHRDCGASTAPGPKPWCNTPGKELGPAPRVLDGRGDMGLWVKAPGESDGDCGVGTGTQPGQFSPLIATALMTGRPTGAREDDP